ncbi:MAG: hypothetical protein J6S95_05225 [Lachnospiraceae bacterium]|nr:hypothetical protein [Lachnospiraceae bacterium]
MKILCLYNNECALPLFDEIRKLKHETVLMTERLSLDYIRSENFDLAVSYTYRYIISGDILKALKGNIVNLHNSYLPYNRGADPNLWSFAENTPRGVTLHYMDEGLDKGYIIAQRLVTEGDGETLKSSYDNLDKNAREMFLEAFKEYDNWQNMKHLPEGKGSYHSVKDGLLLKEKITSYDMKIEDFIKAVR